ncbi:putative DCC family thiol-disulfide oxidoreductase YuxK [Luteimonas cucumeris]|uniref:Putative DCC family thiol-disulfide oxidoreductase YuxK n=1 Tax=Luteimonas cucumeris TaxID=985012 RepID=A0A562L5B0_9GAMM|nr:thiol-disulfide oxidoreductase DCC family protein [Luteimonas cucumeris]TWI02867.1 putative DCC family thiol-disulfide oxidoreductase YuxK [Luteimonas cucumeris]
MNLPDGHPVIVFDGVCGLCNGWVRFLLKRDRRQRYRFAAMQTGTGRGLLLANGLDPDDPMSFLLLDEMGARTDSDAIIAVLIGLGGAWRMATLCLLLPRVLRDPPYRWLARNRYRWFGRKRTCFLPDMTQRHRFIGL